MSRKKTNKEFISQLEEKFGDIFDYSQVNYIDSKTNIDLVCSTHGTISRLPHHQLRSKGCPKCLDKKFDTNILIEKFKECHGDRYDYSFVNYVNKNTKVQIVCKEHGKFEQLPTHHRRGQKCYHCAKEESKSDINELISEFKIIHNNIYTYDKVNYVDWKTYIKIKCSKHGYFEQSPNNHKKGAGCPTCNFSKGELLVSKYLNDMYINHLEQFSFDDCRNKRKLKFDFYIPSLNTCIEYNGIQHYKPVKHFGGEENFKITKKRDNIKIKYCEDNNINLIHIKYNEDIISKINEIINGR